MILSGRKAAVIATSLLALVCSASAQTASAASSARVKVAQSGGRKRLVSKPSLAPETPPPVPALLTPEQMPPVPPQVTYRDGLLTIVASNSTLADILQAVSARTGASVDAPAHLTGERVAAHLGPGTPRQVLSDLLRGPRFDYILVGSDGDPNAVHSIILAPNQSSPNVAVAQVQPRSPSPVQEEMDEEVEEEQPVQPEPQPAPPSQPAPQSPRHRPLPQQPPDQTVVTPTTPTEGTQQPQQPQIKTPEQLLEELRNLQQQQNPQQR